MSQPSDAASPARQTTAQRQREIADDIMLLANHIRMQAESWVYGETPPSLRQLAALQRRLGKIVRELQEGDETA